MNLSVIPTEMLKLVIVPSFVLHVMNSSMSGWSTRSTAMLAPRLVPPCAIAPNAQSYTCMNETGPLARPMLDRTMAFFGRSLLNEKPMPPPVCWISAALRSVEKMPSGLSLPISSSIASTKHAASCPSGVPAPVNVGEFGKNFLEEIILKNSSACLALS